MSRTTSCGSTTPELSQKGDRVEKFKKWAEKKIHEQDIREIRLTPASGGFRFSDHDDTGIYLDGSGVVTYGSHNPAMEISSGAIPEPRHADVPEYTFQAGSGIGLVSQRLGEDGFNTLAMPREPMPTAQDILRANYSLDMWAENNVREPDLTREEAGRMTDDIHEEMHNREMDNFRRYQSMGERRRQQEHYARRFREIERRMIQGSDE